MGDLNAEPWEPAVPEILTAEYGTRTLEAGIDFVRDRLPSYRAYSEKTVGLFNPMWSLLAEPNQGTTLSEDGSRLMLTDQFLLSRGLYYGRRGLRAMRRGNDASDPVPEVGLHRPAELLQEDGNPRPFQLETQTGISDHFPITMRLQTVSG